MYGSPDARGNGGAVVGSSGGVGGGAAVNLDSGLDDPYYMDSEPLDFAHFVYDNENNLYDDNDPYDNVENTFYSESESESGSNPVSESESDEQDDTMVQKSLLRNYYQTDCIVRQKRWSLRKKKAII